MIKTSWIAWLLIGSAIIASVIFIISPKILKENKKEKKKEQSIKGVASASASSAVVWSDNFNNGCSNDCLASSWNGWTIQNNDGGTSGSSPNEWYISCAEEGTTPPGCGSSCVGDQSLHIGHPAASGGDQGATFNETGASNATFKSAISPTINLTGYSTNTLSFDFIAYGSASCSDDRVQLRLSTDNGVTWPVGYQYCLTSVCCGACNGYSQGQWTTFTLALPAAFNNNPNVRISFNWRNNGNGSGTDPSAAIDDIRITTAIPPTTWDGATWSNGTPNSSIDAVIASSVAPASFSCGALTINSGVSLNTTGITANINGNIQNNGNGISGTGTLNIAANSSISGNNLAVTGILTVATGATLTTNNLLTLKSTSISNTATIGNSLGSIIGNVIVERFIPAKRAFRLLASGVTTSASIKTNWQEGQSNANTSSNSNTLPGFGTHITGSTSGQNGFDATLNGSASLFTFSNTSANTWTAAANTGTATLNSLIPYRLFVRGSRAVNLNDNAAASDNTVLRATGSVNNATNVVFNSSSSPTALNTTTTVNQNYSLVPNPYWSAINWSTMVKSNVGGSYFIWDPNLGTRGAYASWNGSVGSAGAINQYIQPGQAFFVTTTGASPSLTISQSDKVNNLTATFRQNQDFAKLSITLTYVNSAGNKIIADGTTAIFGAYKKAIDNNEEALKLTNLDEMLSINRNGTLLSIEARPLPVSDSDSLPLQISQYTQRSYKLELNASNFNYAGKAAYVVDKFLNKTYTINLTGNTTIPVELTSDAASRATNRFVVVFSAAKLPIANNGLNISISPNPAKGKVMLSYAQPSAQNTIVIITDAAGKKVQTLNLGKVQNGSQTLYIDKLQAGTYYVKVNNEVESKTEKLIIQ